MTTIRNVFHHGARIVSVGGVPTRDAASSASAFSSSGGFYTQQVDAAEVERRFGPGRAAATADAPRANRVTPGQMNQINRAHYKR